MEQVALFTIAALYEFKNIDSPLELKLLLKSALDDHNIVGTPYWWLKKVSTALWLDLSRLLTHFISY